MHLADFLTTRVPFASRDEPRRKWMAGIAIERPSNADNPHETHRLTAGHVHLA